jgi:hypothetical protein
MFGLYVEGRADLARQTVTATITPPCFLCFLGPNPAPYTASYDVGGASIFFGVQLRMTDTTRARAPI